MQWNVDHYMKYADERTRAAVDLLMRIHLVQPKDIVDLGCGSGNSTRLLKQRWPDAHIVGVDNSQHMLTAAQNYGQGELSAVQWKLADIATWKPDESVDLIYSNAALHWVPDHECLIQQLFSQVASGGALAFQIPSSHFPAVREIIYRTSKEPQWNERLRKACRVLTMHPASFYYDALANKASKVDIWESEYMHVVPSINAIVDWVSSTGLKPFLTALENRTEQDQFMELLTNRLSHAYPTQADGKILFAFRRLFVIAHY